MMSCEYHEQYLENKLDMWREEIYTEYEKYFSPEEIDILQRIMFDELDMDTMKEKMIDFFNDNPCPSEDLISGEQYFDMLDYNNCNEKELRDRLITDLG
tara:strand:+ start:767 stop:1063 length:297 start_codon:yes stop_codon:yes gene_type:complete